MVLPQMWTPDRVTADLEEYMEGLTLPEEDRVEVRRMAEFLRRLKDKKDGKVSPPVPQGMKAWLLGST